MHDAEIPGYTDPIDGQYVFQVKKTSELPIIANSTSSQPKKSTKPHYITLWHSRMGHQGYRSLTILKNLRSGIQFHGTISAGLCEDRRKGDQTGQPSKSYRSQVNEFLSRVYSDLEGPFPRTRQGYRYYISFLEESESLIDIEPLKFKDNALAAFKNYKGLREKQSACQLKIIHTDRGGEYMGEFDNCLKKNGISNKVTALYSPEQNGKAERVNGTIIGPVRAILAQQRLSKSLWAEITKAVVYFQNRSPICQGTTTEFENLKG